VGYDLHVTRGEARPIAEAEWRSYVSGDPEFDLTGAADVPTPEGALRYENPGLACWRSHPSGEIVWFDFRDGRIVVKNPDEPTIERMLIVARALGARVEGDDGEIYDSPGGTPRPPRVSLGARLRGWLAKRRPAPGFEPVQVPFAVGQRVRDFRGHTGTVIAIDVAANHGLGRIEVRFDAGGEVTFAAVGHGLEPVPEGEAGDGVLR
jgi:hypothetical protein